MPVLGPILPSCWNNASILRDKKKELPLMLRFFIGFWNCSDSVWIFFLNLFEDSSIYFIMQSQEEILQWSCDDHALYFSMLLQVVFYVLIVLITWQCPYFRHGLFLWWVVHLIRTVYVTGKGGIFIIRESGPVLFLYLVVPTGACNADGVVL